jgi:threonine/homoserine/homoserine lactone efflux protein
MLDTHNLLLFVAAGLLLNLAPGPDMLYIIARSLGQGLQAGLVSALGIAVGCMGHALAAALGIGAVMQAAPWAYDLLRAVGATYLCWLGLRALTQPAGPAAAAVTTPVRLRTVFAQGVATNALNPKVALFFLAFLPQFTDPAAGSVALQMLLLGAIFIVNGLLVCLAVAYGAARARHWLQGRGAVARQLPRFSGAVLLSLGLKLALDRSP